MFTSFKQNIKKGFVTPIVLISMMTLFLFIAYNAPKIYGIYKNSYKVEDVFKDKNLEIVQGYLRNLIEESENLSKEEIINIFNNKNIDLKFKEFEILFDNENKYFIKKGVDDEKLILDFIFDTRSKRFIFKPIKKGEFNNND